MPNDNSDDWLESAGTTALMAAARYGDTETVRPLIDAGANVNANNGLGETALMAAARYGDTETVRALIDAGADVNANDGLGETTLMVAAACANAETVRALSDAGADVNANDGLGKTALMVAASCGNADSVRALIDAGADVNAINKNSETALFHIGGNNHHSLRHHNVNIAQMLLSAGIDVNAKNRLGQTALFSQVEKGSENVCRLLIEKGKALVNVKDKIGRTPLYFALHSHKRNQWAVFSQEEKPGSFSVAQLLLDNGARIVDSDAFNCGLLMFWIEFYLKNEQLYKDLDSVIAFTVKNSIPSETVVHSILNVLLCLSMLNCEDGIPTFVGYAELLNQATSRGIAIANVDRICAVITTPSSTSLHELLHLLILSGVNLNTADSQGNTVLHYSSLLQFYGVHQEIVMKILNLLNENGANFSVRNIRHESAILFCLSPEALSLAEANNTWSQMKTLVEICRFLLEVSGSECDEINKKGQTVFHLIVKLFQDAFKIRSFRTREVVLEEVMKLLLLFSPPKIIKRVTVNKPDNDDHNSPLHLWATLCLPSGKKYTEKVTTNHTFQEILDRILKHFLSCGVMLNARNLKEQTPFHLCKTWSATKLLIQSKANKNDVDYLKRPPLLVAAYEKLFEETIGKFFPDATEDPFTFFKACNDLGIELWAEDIDSRSILSIVLKSEDYVLTEALVKVACEDPNTHLQDILAIVCKDTSKRSYWKTTVVENILKTNRRIDVLPALRYSCLNIKPMVESSSDISVAPVTNIQHASEIDSDETPLKKPKYDHPYEQYMPSVHLEIAKRLRYYGADTEACKDLTKDFPELKDLLTSEIDLSQIPPIIPWNSHSDSHKPKLNRVARRQNSIAAANCWYHEDPIGKGASGYVFAGIRNDGREVAIKRVEKLTLAQQENKREIANLIDLADCRYVVKYISFDAKEEHFAYICLELMEGNLDDYLQSDNYDRNKSVILCKHLLLGLDFLHMQSILHRDLKPENILYKTHPELILKIADFGVSRKMDANASYTVMNSTVGTRKWIAPEVLSGSSEHTNSSDIFACGLIVHYIMQNEKHPFSPKDCTGMSTSQVITKTEENILNHLTADSMAGLGDSLSPETTNLVKKLLKSDPNQRPTAAEALDHPMFWLNKEKIDFLIAVGEEFRSCNNRAIRRPKEKLERKFRDIVQHGNWNDEHYTHMHEILAEMNAYRTKCGRERYDVKKAEDLLILFKNAKEHFQDQKCNPIGKYLLEDFIYLDYFPNLVMELFEIVITVYKWDKKKLRIKHVRRKDQ